MQNAIEPDEAILYYYWLGPEVLLVVAIDQQRLVVDRVVLSAAHRGFLNDVITAIRTFSGAMDHDILCEFDRTVQECSPFWLPKNVWALMEGKRRLIVSPHHKLHLFPFHALPWKDGLLIESFAVSYVPNLSLLLVPARPAQRPKILLSGVGDFEPGLKLPKLPEIGPELDGVAEAYRRKGIETEVLAGEADQETVVELERERNTLTLLVYPPGNARY